MGTVSAVGTSATLATWALDQPHDELLALGAGRLLLALGLAGVLWLPLPPATVGAHDRAWAVAAMSALTLVTLVARPWPEHALPRAMHPRKTRQWLILIAELIVVLIALTGGSASPLAPLVVLLAVMWRQRDGTVARLRTWQVGAAATGCYVLAALVTHSLHLGTAGMVWMAERAICLGLAAGAVSLWRAGLLTGDARAQELRRTAADWHDEALALERTRSAMLAHVSHELLGPVGAIRTSGGLLSELLAADAERPVRLRGARSTGITRMLAAIERNGARLELCVQDLLELARLEEGRPAVSAGWQRCADIFEHTLTLLAPLLDSKQQHVRVQLDDPARLVWGDARRIERVTTNLVSNAHKYAGEGATIMLRAASTDAGTRLEVADDGPSIPPEALGMLFDRYYRAPGVPGQGSGLGLAIVRAEVELHGGDVWAESVPGEGCTFVCLFPSPPNATGAPTSVFEASI